VFFLWLVMDYKYKRRLIVGIALVLLLFLYLFRNLATPVRIFGFILGLAIFYLIDHMFEVEFELQHYYMVLVILAFGILFSPFYFLSSVYDKVLHFIMPIIGCCLIFFIVDKKKLTLQWKLWITFMFILSFLAIHEMGEYLMDLLWDLNLQGVYVRDITGTEKLNLLVSRIDDTMIDLLLGFGSACVFVIGKITGHYYIKNFGKKKK
jgi:hypothetical protein